MPNAFVQSNSTLGVSPLSVALGVRSTAGNNYAVGVVANVASSAVTVTDNAASGGNTYTELLPVEPISGGGYTLYTFYCLGIKLPASGVTTITATVTGGATLAFITVGEYSGASTLDAGSYARATGASSGNLSVPTTLISAGELLFGFAFTGSVGVLSAGSGWTLREYAGTSQFLMMLDQLTGPGAGAQTLVPATQGSANAWAASVFGLYTPAPGPPASTAVFPLPVYKAIGIL